MDYDFSMAWHDDPKHPFAGIAEKLKRADENIAYLHGEIGRFFDGCKYPVIPYIDGQEWEDAINYHASLAIPIAFSVLCGEIIHHMRSCLDHIAWHFSSAQYRREHDSRIEFPIYRDKPLTKDQIARYNGKVEGITKPRVRELIEELQPYHRGSDAINHPLCIIHDMDRFDKHRELMMISSCIHWTVPGATIADIVAAMRQNEGKPLTPEEQTRAERTLQMETKISPQVAFVQFGNRQREPIIPSLKQLQDIVDRTVNIFAAQV